MRALPAALPSSSRLILLERGFLLRGSVACEARFNRHEIGVVVYCAACIEMPFCALANVEQFIYQTRVYSLAC